MTNAGNHGTFSMPINCLNHIARIRNRQIAVSDERPSTSSGLNRKAKNYS